MLKFRSNSRSLKLCDDETRREILSVRVLSAPTLTPKIGRAMMIAATDDSGRDHKPVQGV